MGIFSKNQYPDAKLKRTAFDLSFQNNLTTNFGVLKPVFCKEVLAGDTFDIDTTFDLKFMPTVFPIQNRIRAAVKFFYVRTRSLYDNFKEWYTNNDTEDGGLPYMSMTYGTSVSQFKTYEDLLRFLQLGGLADSFGIPVSTTYTTDYRVPCPLTAAGLNYSPAVLDDHISSAVLGFYKISVDSSFNGSLDSLPLSTVGWQRKTVRRFNTQHLGASISWTYDFSTPASHTLKDSSGYLIAPPLAGSTPVSSDGIAKALFSLSGLNITIPSDALLGYGTSLEYNDYLAGENPLDYCSLSSLSPSVLRNLVSSGWGVYPVLISASAPSSTIGMTSPIVYSVGTYSPDEGNFYIKVPENIDWNDLPPEPFDPSTPPSNYPATPFFAVLIVPPNHSTSSSFVIEPSAYKTYDDLVDEGFQSGDTFNPWSIFSPSYTQSASSLGTWLANSSGNRLSAIPKISALPFRAYEMIYNSFYRDERNNPFQIDGKTYYDKFLPTMKGGEDKTNYKLHFANWYQDQFTTALPSPQQGEAPLVGISSSGRATLVDPVTERPVYAQLEVGSDGDTVVGYTTDSSDPAVHRTLVNAATSGISINDFRNVNALQRYLEKNMRQGLRYKDMIQARWGVSPTYKELNMPEFIGGAIQDVTPYQVNQQSQDTSDSPLGSYAGQLGCRGGSSHKVHRFCDEPGYIIGILEVLPTPVYDSLLPKHMTKFEQLDFFNPEFGHIGMQSIPVQELAMSAALNHGVPLDTTFGYQRAWYDYLTSNDEVHGQFRTSLRDFCIHREFGNVPTLSEEFLLMSDGESNNIFSVQTDADGNEIDKVLGQIYFDVKAKRPIPRFGIPRLE